MALLASSSFTFAQSWNATRNTGTNPTYNFIGTTNIQSLIFKANNTEGLSVLPDEKIN